ncbi:protein of unknown function [Chitinophaga costaii]|uniref:L-glutaminase n=1 Tax=Chitinophaga costaii TaxID=1335309 RepID=A0A1C4DUC5_9BACT|nr:glutaminase family protein [Chitinophaga costaii]PUZ27793.1 DUF4965 domain-containing protein [Chitinophaga costaii]SCC34861.1 protein of unknown function [Chitinophaga costaii]
MKKHIGIIALTLCGLAANAQEFRAPAYPLITHDPYFSVWSNADTASSAPTHHWTGATQSLISMVKVDGKTYRVLGQDAPSFKVYLPTSEDGSYTAQYTESQPAANWAAPDFNDGLWKTGKAPWTNDGRGTQWKTHDIWMRRTFTLADKSFKNLLLKLNHDDDAEVYINGTKVYAFKGWLTKFGYFPLPAAVVSKMKAGKNVLAIHVTNNVGGAMLDAGLVESIQPTATAGITPAQQKSVTLHATQTIYDLACGPVQVQLTFSSPLFLQDLKMLSRPVSYVTWKAQSTDGSQHDVQVYLGASTDLAVNTPSQAVTTQQYHAQDLDILKAGTVEQPILKKKGDDLRIDWGYVYVAAPQAQHALQYISTASQASASFTGTHLAKTTATKGHSLVLNTVLPLGKVGSDPVEKFVLVGYDDLYAIQYFHTNLKAWWKLDTTQTIEQQLAAAATSYKAIMNKCDEVNAQIYHDAEQAGGDTYARLCVLGYRQSIAAHKLVKSPQGDTLFLSKENFSNGCINTVDVTYPSAPLYLAYNPDLMKGMLNGIFYFSESGIYKKDYAAHDLGTYPLANGEAYGEGMPVEECGNMIILTDAIVRASGDKTFAAKHWKTLTTWAHYLDREGLDPANQLCTDDFAGHLARNANLSVKAIVALACYADMAQQLGKTDSATLYRTHSETMVKKWMELADAGDHYALTFNDKNTWSEKYNMVWDKVLHLDLFPQSVYDKELAYYKTKQNKYGLPLDSRKGYTKSDWVCWTASLTDNQNDFRLFTDPMYKYATETVSRVPISDWHETVDGRMVGFQGRSVVGGYFMEVLKAKMKDK